MIENSIRHELPKIVDDTPLPLTELTAISPIDGRYAEKVASLRNYFSEYALMKGRIYVEIKWLEKLSSLGIGRKFSSDEVQNLESIWQNFGISDAKSIKRIEKTTRHDVKAVEYFLKRKLEKHNMSGALEMAHLGLTSEDVTNLSQNIYISKAKDEILVPSIWRLIDIICEKATDHKNQPMIGRTHAKKAVSTTFGKELSLFAFRLSQETKILSDTRLTGKLTGAVGIFPIQLSLAISDQLLLIAS